MRYKAAPLSIRTVPGGTPRSSRYTSDSFRLFVVALLVPVILIPLAVANASGSISLSPNQAVAGTTVQASGQGFQPGARGQLLFDGSATAMPTFRVDHSGRMTASFVVPKGASLGSHTISVTVTSKKSTTAAVTTTATSATKTTGGGTTKGGAAVPRSGASTDTKAGTKAPKGGTSAGTRTAAAAVVVASAALMVVAAISSPSPTPTPVPATPAPTATRTPAPTATPPVVADPQPSFPIRAAFYYPWFPEAWNQQGMNPFTAYHPSLGFYSSSSTSTIAAHLAAFRYAGIEAGISSWWGQGSQTDQRLPAILAATAGSPTRWSIYYE